MHPGDNTYKPMMTPVICAGCQSSIFINENKSLYEDTHRHQYHTEARCLKVQLATSQCKAGSARKQALEEAAEAIRTHSGAVAGRARLVGSVLALIETERKS